MTRRDDSLIGQVVAANVVLVALTLFAASLAAGLGALLLAALAFAGGSAVAPAGAALTVGGGWAGRWLSTATGTTRDRKAMKAQNAVAVVLAAGMGTRMKSDLPKVLCQVCGKPMVKFVLAALRKAGLK